MDDQVIGQPSNPIYQEPKTKSAKWLWILVILIIIGGLVFAYVRGIGPFANINNLSKSTPSPTPESVQATSTPEASPSPTPASVDKTKAKVRVLNGSGTTGKAATVKAFLETLGWKVSSIGNADNSDFTQTEVRVKDKFSTYSDAMVSDLSSKYSATANSKALEASDSADIEVTIGSK